MAKALFGRTAPSGRGSDAPLHPRRACDPIPRGRCSRAIILTEPRPEGAVNLKP